MDVQSPLGQISGAAVLKLKTTSDTAINAPQPKDVAVSHKKQPASIPNAARNTCCLPSTVGVRNTRAVSSPIVRVSRGAARVKASSGGCKVLCLGTSPVYEHRASITPRAKDSCHASFSPGVSPVGRIFKVHV